MKKSLLLFLVLPLMIACGDDDNKKSAGQTTTQGTIKEITAEFTQAGSIGGFEQLGEIRTLDLEDNHNIGAYILNTETNTISLSLDTGPMTELGAQDYACFVLHPGGSSRQFF